MFTASSEARGTADALLARGDLAAAERAYRVAQPTLAVVHNLGAVLALQGRFSEARPLLERCHKFAPNDREIALTLASATLGDGDYAAGWPLYENRLELPSFNTEIPPIPVWRGESLAGKAIVVWREQGFGDVIQCARFIPLLQQQGARVLVVTFRELVSLFTSMGIEAYGLDEGEVTLPIMPDYHTHPFSIPRWLGITVETLPSQPYLKAKSRATGARIGTIWRGRPTYSRDHWRSLPDAIGERLLTLPKTIHLAPERSGAADFQETAEIIAGLDLVISSCTSVAHLAAAMGKPTWVMLPAWGADWRWMEGRQDSPWYPSVRLFRQHLPGDWSSVLAEVTAALEVEYPI